MKDDPTEYVGLPVEQARQRAAEHGWQPVRELEPDALITMEYREGRLNLTVRQGVVESCWAG